MADCNYALEGWDWENIFTSSLLEHDLPWHGELSEPESINAAATPSLVNIHPLNVPSSVIPVNVTNVQLSVKSGQEGDDHGTPISFNAVIPTNTSDGSLDSSGYNHDTPVSSLHLLSSETSLINPPAASHSKKKKWDPRLECPNFRAGRIPCSCPEEDELEAVDIGVEALVKKRSKVGARCQVPTCGEGISHLKGYHQRHRVCLGCANSPKVMLKDLPHRYCQQCGKFHRLTDFDEGKRSCRRKLERHNRRRRRHPVDEEREDPDCEAPLLEFDNDRNNLHLPSEGAATQNAQSVAASTGQRQGMKTARFKQKTKESIAQDVLHSVSDDSSGSLQRSEEDKISSNKGNLDKHCLLNILVGNGIEHIEEGSRSIKHSLKESRTSHASTRQIICRDYVSPCPTGRISFKLYDWNPADFPRRLRQQIFEWLANMPVELESYVRSGCIILTFFVTMPPLMWDKVLAEWEGQVQTFIIKSGVKGTGQLATQMVETSIILKNGKATSAFCKDLLAPFVVDLYPHSLEAGCCTQIYVFGFNFSGGRFLLSFGEQYVECSNWESVDCSHLTAQKIWNSIDNIEVLKVTVFLPDSEKFGLAYAEVESVNGLSNFMPMVVADKALCMEINTIGLNHAVLASFNVCGNTLDKDVKPLRSEFGMDIFSDLGWALKYTNECLPVDILEVREALIRRLKTLLLFSLEHCCPAITQRIVQIAARKFVIQNVYNVEAPELQNTSDTSKDMNAIIVAGWFHFPIVTATKGQLTPRLIAEAGGTQAIHKLKKIKGLQGLESALEQSHLLERSEFFIKCSSEGRMKILPIYVPLLEKWISSFDNGWRYRKQLGTTGTLTLGSSNKRFIRILVAAVGIVAVCTGLCFMLQNPHEVAEISMSLRRCLWGSNDVVHA